MTPMKRWILALSVVVFSAAMLPTEADARRLGGGGSAGMRRDLPARSAPDSLPARPATPNAAPNAAAPTAPAAPVAPARNSWMGPIAGLAAGLGIAALASHFGMGGELANTMMIVLLAVAAFAAVRFVMRRMSAGSGNGARLAGAGAPFGAAGFPAPARALEPMAAAAPIAVGQAPALPAGFDAIAFERVAKLIFIRMQAANDSGDLNDLRAFTTPEMFAAAKLDLNERGGTTQQTDVVQIDAKVVDVAEEAQRQIVSVRFKGLVREEKGGAATDFDEVWHLVRPTDGSREWAIAGIQQTAEAA